MVSLGLPTKNRGRQRFYAGFGVTIAIWSAIVLWFAIDIVQLDVYWMSYYTATYAHGFVRRGLAGELVGLFPGHYFAVSLSLRWLSTTVYLCGLATVAAVVLVRRRSERSLMVAMLIPLLPFGVPFAAYSARPDLFGAAALAQFASALMFARSRAVAISCCLAYGAAAAALTLVHEAVGLLFAFGAVLAVIVLGGALGASQSLGAFLAVTPGAVTAAAVAAFGRHGLASRLCSEVPHHPMPNVFGTVTSPPALLRYVLSGRPPPQSDYHDWVCRNVMPTYDDGIVDAIRSVGHIGVAGLTASLAFGAVGLVATMWGLSEVSGVPLRAFAEAVRGRTTWVLTALLLFVPIFLTGYDWTRWLTTVSFDMGVVFILFAARRPEIEQEPTPKSLRVFTFLVVGLGLVVIGSVPGFGVPRMV
ncbi:hypothetical protein AWC05_05180 [Mycobacterium florentinum]|uniref:Uncharacterized protein n=1 Tax=Mycobacterium florentinum TaxID=292462 RepID=A0A1X1TU74_MYCFL|nr:hypothetical protein [Mycobacterium florentinum]MCV7408418.1 hypothetical protein [Mycobacterium florentinum]ORV47969.1 hypothetical protein AWC05_05180 [Mycobacterium florentinum]BBX78088.1 hypothetical protein MFLOJ_18750 [Mycobacterium florentinum]